MPATKTAAKKSVTAAKKRAVKRAAPQTAAATRWRDSSGQDIAKGVTVKHDGKIIGTAAYRHTHETDGAKIGMIGVAVRGDGSVSGRTVKHMSFRADELSIVVE